MLGRAASADHEALSDGYLSDSTMDEGKEKNKKKKAWKVRSKANSDKVKGYLLF